MNLSREAKSEKKKEIKMEKLKEGLHQGDCIAFMEKMPEESVDLIVTDPPYLINYTSRRTDKNHDFCSPIAGDSDPNLIKNYIRECYRILKPDSAMYMFCDCTKVDFFKQELEKYFKVKNLIIWAKNHWSVGDLQAAFGKQYEMIFLVNKGRKKFNGKRISDVWHFDRVNGKAQMHQNQKPLELIERCILKHSEPNEIVFDGFSGSGTTELACFRTGRKFVGCEVEKKYYDMSQKRLGGMIF